MMEKYCNKRKSSLEEPGIFFRTNSEENCLGDYSLGKFTADVSYEVREICEKFARRGMFDEYSEGEFLDDFITQKYEIIRNKLRRQHLRYLYAIEGVEARKTL